MSFGAFMEGLQGGVKSGQNIRRERQMDDIYDAARRKIKNEEKADDIGRKSRGLPMGDDSALGDPLGQKIWDWASGLFGGNKAEATTAVPDPGAVAMQEKVARVDSLTPEDGYAGGFGGAAYADGGTPADEEERKRELARAQRYGATAEQAIPAVGNFAGKSILAGPRTTRNALHAAADVVDMGTDDPIDPGMLGGTGALIEYGFDAPRAAIGSGLRWAGDKIAGGAESLATPQQAVPAPTPGTPAGAGGPRRGGQRNPAKQAPKAAIPAPGAAPAAPAAPEQKAMSPDVIKRIPWDKVNPMELPKFKTQDWVSYRETAIDQMVMRGGVSVTDAMDKVDQQVIGMQQRGTKALLQEAIMRVQSGDLKGAGNALVQMFQYVPSGTDAVVGTYNGQLVAQFIDEETGQPVGDPTPVDAKMLGDLWQQYANPAAWAQMAQDRAKLADQEKRTGIQQGVLDLSERRLNEVEIPSAQSDADYRALLGQGALAKAVGGGGDSGLKPSEQLAIDDDVRAVVEAEAMQMPEDHPLYEKMQDPDIRREILIAIMKKKRATGSPTEEILSEILSSATE